MNKVSVCMATYNGEKFIQRQLKSILYQLSVDDEVVISDDKSSDKTLDIVRSFNDKRIKITVNDGLPGPLGNFEHAIRQATGDFILLSDQDDEWLSDKVDALRLLLREYDVVLSDCQVVNDKSEMIHTSFFSFRKSKPGFWYNLFRNSYVGCCMAFRREVLTYVLPFPPKVHMHDWWIGLLAEVRGRVYFYNRPLLYYVRHGGNASPTGESGYGLFQQFKNRYYLLWHVVKRLMA